MKKRLTILMAAFTLLAFLAIPLGMRGQTSVTFTAGEDTGDTSVTKDGVTVSMSTMSRTDNYRCYANTAMTIASTAGNITNVELTCTGSGNSNYGPGKFSLTEGYTGTYTFSGYIGTWVGSADEISLTASAQVRMTKIVVTIGGTAPTTFTVTYDCDGGTGCPENVTGIEAGTTITLADAPSKTDYTFDGWNDGTTTYQAGASYTVNSNVTMTAQWAEIISGDEQWILTNLADLTENDVFVIVGNGYAMTNNNGTSSAPGPVAVTISGNEITSAVTSTIKWTVSGDATNGYSFSPNGSTNTWLYCNTNAATSSNNNLRVGNGGDYNRIVFELTSDNYLVTKDNYVARYLSHYVNNGSVQDWRGYINTNSAVAISFYKKVTGGAIPPSITAANVDIAYNATSGSIAYTINNGVTGGTMAVTTESDWLTLDQGTTSPISFTCSANESAAERTATVTLTYTYNRTTATANVTVTQAGNPNVPGTENNPYTVAQARAAIDASTGTQGVYATGTVSEIPTAWSTQYSNITFNFVDNVGDTDFLQAYRCVSGTGVDASEVAVGDVVVVYGNLKKYQSTYEFDAGCTLVSLTHPAGYVEAPTFSPAAGIYEEAQNVTISCADGNATIYYTLNGTEPTNASTQYTTAINVATTTTIKAIAYVGTNASAVTTATYSIVSLGNISDITEVGTAYEVQGTIVATNSKGFVMGDGTGYVYYYKNAAFTQSVGDMVKVLGTTGTYGHIIQFTNTATVTEATSSNYDGTPGATLITEVPDYTQGYHLSDYFEFEGALTKSGSSYFVTFGDTDTIQISYPTSAQGITLTTLDGKNVHVKGYFAGINTSGKFTVMLESVEEVASTEPAITIDPDIINAPAEGAEGTLTLTPENITTFVPFIQYCDAEGEEASYDWFEVEIDGTTISYTVNANNGVARTGYFTVTTYDDGGIDDDVYSNIVTVNQAAYVAPNDNDFVRITSLDQLTDGSKVIIAARYDEEHTNGYYAMPGVTSGKPTGVEFTSEISGNNEILPASIVDEEDDYYWIVNLTENGYTFTNANGQMIGYGTSGTDFSNGNSAHKDWTISRETAAETAMVAEYIGFVIRNSNTDTRAFAFNGEKFGAYSTTANLTGSSYNFFLDFFVQAEASETVTQTTQLSAGWNWFSTYIAGEPTDLLQALKTSLSANAEMIWSDGDGSTDYYPEDDEWEGTLDPNGLKNNQMYMIKTTAACTVELTGMPVDPATVEITINPGWNWIGFPCTEEMSVANAFANFQSADEDMLWSNNDGTTDYYADDNEWDGTLVTLKPGQGYMYYSNSNTSKTLVFRTNKK